MKRELKFALCFIVTLLTGCYSKEKEIRINSSNGRLEYAIWVYRNTTIIEKFSIPIEQLTKYKKDSLNKAADNFIETLKEAEKD